MTTAVSDKTIDVAATALAEQPIETSSDPTTGRVAWGSPTLTYANPSNYTPENMEVCLDLDGLTSPYSVITGFGGRAKSGNMVTLKVWYAEIGADGALGTSQALTTGPEPSDSLECEIQLPDGWVAVGFGVKAGDDVTNTVLYARQWDADSLSLTGDVKAYAPSGKSTTDVDMSTPQTESSAPDIAGELALTCIGLGVKKDHVSRIYGKFTPLVSSGMTRRVVWDAPTLPYFDPQDKTQHSMEAIVDLEGLTKPDTVITGFGARAKDGNIVTLKVWYAGIGADGNLVTTQTVVAGTEPSDSLECEIQLPAGWAAVGFGIQAGDDVTNTVLWGRQWDASTKSLLGQPKAYFPSGKTATDVDMQTPETPNIDPDLANQLALIGIGVGVSGDNVNRIYGKYAKLVECDEDVANPISSYAAYLPGTALEFLPGPSPFSGSGRTLELWIKPTSSGALANWCAYSGDFLTFGLESDGSFSMKSLDLEVAPSGNSHSWSTATTRAFDGGWHHVAFVLTLQSLSIYFDGVLLESKSMASSQVSKTSRLVIGAAYKPWFPGYQPSGEPWQELTDYYVGSVDEIRLWGQAQTASDIQNAFQTRIRNPTDALIGLWSFDGRSLADHSGRGNNPTPRGKEAIIVPSTAADVLPPAGAPSVAAAGEPFPDHGRWATDCQVRYAVTFYSDAPNTMLGPWETRVGPWSSWLSDPSSAYADLSGIATDPQGWALGRRIYRQFKGQLPQRIGFIADNTTTTFSDRRS